MANNTNVSDVPPNVGENETNPDGIEYQRARGWSESPEDEGAKANVTEQDLASRNDDEEDVNILDSDLSLSSEESVEEGGANDEEDNVSLISHDNDERGHHEVDGNNQHRTRSGRTVKRINYNEFHRKGTQMYQQQSNITEDGRKLQTKIKVHGTFKKIAGMFMLNIGTESEFDQLGVKAGIRKHGEAAVAAIIKEYPQLKDNDDEISSYCDDN